jgi:hypothetical protein
MVTKRGENSQNHLIFLQKEHIHHYFSIVIPIEQSRCLHLGSEKSIFREEMSVNGVVYVLRTSRKKIKNTARRQF